MSKINSVDIPYWVFGGLGYAAMCGGFYRYNNDVDIMVLDEDFKDFESILDDICKENDWRICKTFLRSVRPKNEIFINKHEIMSVVPVYKTDSSVKFVSNEGDKEYPSDILTKQDRCLGGFVFPTPRDEFLYNLLFDYLSSKKNYPNPEKRREDARHILSEKDFKKFFPDFPYR